MLEHTHDETVGAWYFSEAGKGDVCRTEDLGGAHVLIDWDHYGNVIGVEVMVNDYGQARSSSDPEKEEQ